MLTEGLVQRAETVADLELTPDDEGLLELLKTCDIERPELEVLLDGFKQELDAAEKKLAALPKPAIAEPGPLLGANITVPIGTQAKATSATVPAEPERVFKAGDEVMAYHPDNRRKLAKADVIQVSRKDGGLAYLVRFKGKDFEYRDGSLKNERHEIPAADVKPSFAFDKARAEKRKAQEEAAVGATVNAPTNNGKVISGPAAIDMSLVNRQYSKVSDGPAQSETYKKKRKLEKRKTYDEHASNWKNFQTKGKINKRAKNESMFRTEEGNLKGRGKLFVPLLP